MTDSITEVEKQQELFIKQIVESGEVWGLYCDEGWSNADSCELENTIVYPFWSTQQLAQECAVDEWGVYAPKALPLDEFLENWCIGMYKEYILCGINWDANLEGGEVDTIDLALQVMQEVKRQNKELKFRFYNDLGDFEKMLHEVIEEERKSIH